MKIFLDTANVNEIRDGLNSGFLDGVTTNPTLIAREGKKYEQTISEICDFFQGPISAECVTETAPEMIKEGKRLAAIASNIVVKIPMTREGLKATQALRSEGVKINMTLCFSAMQAFFAARAGATYMSPFIGRLDDAGHDGMQVIRDILIIYRNYNYSTEVLVASIRHPLHVLEAAKLGAHVSTMPYEIFLKLFKHPLTDQGIERFLADYKKTLQKERTASKAIPAAR